MDPGYIIPRMVNGPGVHYTTHGKWTRPHENWTPRGPNTMGIMNYGGWTRVQIPIVGMPMAFGPPSKYRGFVSYSIWTQATKTQTQDLCPLAHAKIQKLK